MLIFHPYGPIAKAKSEKQKTRKTKNRNKTIQNKKQKKEKEKWKTNLTNNKTLNFKKWETFEKWFLRWAMWPIGASCFLIYIAKALLGLFWFSTTRHIFVDTCSRCNPYKPNKCIVFRGAKFFVHLLQQNAVKWR